MMGALRVHPPGPLQRGSLIRFAMLLRRFTPSMKLQKICGFGLWSLKNGMGL